MEQHNDGGDEEEITQWMELQLVDAGKLNSKKWHHFIQVQRWVEQPSTEEAVRQKNRTKPDAEDCRTNGWGTEQKDAKGLSVPLRRVVGYQKEWGIKSRPESSSEMSWLMAGWPLIFTFCAEKF